MLVILPWLYFSCRYAPVKIKEIKLPPFIICCVKMVETIHLYRLSEFNKTLLKQYVVYLSIIYWHDLPLKSKTFGCCNSKILMKWFYHMSHVMRKPVYAICEQQRRWSAWAFVGRLCDKYHNLMSWLTDQPKKKALFFAFTPRTKILKRELSQRKLREISHKLAQIIFFLLDILRRNSAKTRGETLRTFVGFLHKISRIYSAKLGVISKNVIS